MSQSNAPQGPEFQGPPQQAPQGWGPGPQPGGQALPVAPAKNTGVWLRRAALVVPALLVGACVGGIGGSGGGTVGAVPAPAPVTTVTATVPGPTVTAKAPKPKPAPTVTVTAEAPESAPEPEPAPDSDPEPEPEPEPEPQDNGLSTEQQNAVESAQSYLEFTAFSRQGLIQQLSSDAGDGYPKDVATAAVDSLDIDYKKQAAKAAKSYLEISSFSRQGLIEQLSSDAGDGYTRSQAEYGVKQAGL